MAKEEITLPKIGDKIIFVGRLPRIIEVGIKHVDEEGEERTREGEISSIEMGSPTGAKVVVVDAGPGKTIGVELPEPPKGYRWFDAHECDGAAKRGYGWFITPEQVLEVSESDDEET